jgi:hypothetical protein
MCSKNHAYARYGHTTINISLSEYCRRLEVVLIKVFYKILYTTSSVSISSFKEIFLSNFFSYGYFFRKAMLNYLSRLKK